MCPTVMGTNVRALTPYFQVKLDMGSRALGGTALPQSVDRSLKAYFNDKPSTSSTRMATTRRATTTCWCTGRTAAGWLIVLAYRELSRGPGVSANSLLFSFLPYWRLCD
jgi:hypothetical protein